MTVLHQLQNRLNWITSNYAEYDYHPCSFRELISSEIRKMYESGELPLRLSKKHCVAGFKVYGNFLLSHTQPIIVGPKPPSRYRGRYAMSCYNKSGYRDGTVPIYKIGV